MTNEEVEHIFEPYQTDRNKELNPKGVGIGLAISKLICENLGGSISVQTKPNHGSKFIFTVQVYENRDESMIEKLQSSENSN